MDVVKNTVTSHSATLCSGGGGNGWYVLGVLVVLICLFVAPDDILNIVLTHVIYVMPLRVYTTGDGSVLSWKQPGPRISAADLCDNGGKHSHHNRTRYVSWLLFIFFSSSHDAVTNKREHEMSDYRSFYAPTPFSPLLTCWHTTISPSTLV